MKQKTKAPKNEEKLLSLKGKEIDFSLSPNKTFKNACFYKLLN